MRAHTGRLVRKQFNSFGYLLNVSLSSIKKMASERKTSFVHTGRVCIKANFGNLTC